MRRLVCLLLFCFVVGIIPSSSQAVSQGFENPFTDLLDEHGAVMLLIDPESGNILQANAAASDFYGYSKDQLQTMRIGDINQLSEQEVEAEMQAAAREERNYFLFEHALESGEIRFVEVYSYPAQFDGKSVLFTIVIDVHDHYLTEQAHDRNRTVIYVGALLVILCLFILTFFLILSRKRLRRRNLEIQNFNELRQTFIDADASLTYLKDDALRYVFVNDVVLQLYRLPESEIIGKNDFELSKESFAKMHYETDRAVLDRQERIVDEIAWQGRIYRTNKFPVKLISGRYGVGAYVHDITKEAHARKRSRIAALRNAILLDILTRSFDNRYKMLDYVLQEALKLTESKFGYIYHYDENRRQFSLNSWSQEVMQACQIADRQRIYDLEATGFWGEVVRQRKPMILNDFQKNHPLKKGYPQGHAPLYRFMSVPVTIDGNIVAVVGLANKDEPYGDGDVEEMLILMNGVWNAVIRRDTEETLTLERNKYRQTLLSIGDGVAIINGQGKIDMLNRQGEKLTGWLKDDAVGQPYHEVFKLVEDDGSPTKADPIQRVLQTNESVEMQGPLCLISCDGTNYSIEDSAAPVLDESGQTVGVVMVFRDVTERQQQLEQIEHLSFHDPLTGLYNRRFFEEEMQRLDTQRNLPIALLIGDVNGLKLANDVFGHHYGDRLLCQVAASLQNECRSDDIIARWGGDEFTVLLPKTTSEDADAIKKRIQQSFIQRQSGPLKGSISIGVASKHHAGEKLMGILEDAEEQMYQEKSIDRNTFRSEAIESILNELHEKSPRERKHAENVRNLCDRIAKKINLSETDRQLLKDAAFYHDIGKIALDSRYLGQRTVPYMQEDSDVRRHPIVGYRLLQTFDDTLDLAGLVLTHHEHWDGSGYPKGLKGDQIPLLARIIAVAESYEWLVHDLNEKDGQGYAAALVKIREKAGTLFDPKLVAALAHVVRGR